MFKKQNKRNTSNRQVRVGRGNSVEKIAPYSRAQREYEDRTGLCYCCNLPLSDCKCSIRWSNE